MGVTPGWPSVSGARVARCCWISPCCSMCPRAAPHAAPVSASAEISNGRLQLHKGQNGLCNPPGSQIPIVGSSHPDPCSARHPGASSPAGSLSPRHAAWDHFLPYQPFTWSEHPPFPCCPCRSVLLMAGRQSPQNLSAPTSPLLKALWGLPSHLMESCALPRSRGPLGLSPLPSALVFARDCCALSPFLPLFLGPTHVPADILGPAPSRLSVNVTFLQRPPLTAT